MTAATEPARIETIGRPGSRTACRAIVCATPVTISALDRSGRRSRGSHPAWTRTSLIVGERARGFGRDPGRENRSAFRSGQERGEGSPACVLSVSYTHSGPEARRQADRRCRYGDAGRDIMANQQMVTIQGSDLATSVLEGTANHDSRASLQGVLYRRNRLRRCTKDLERHDR